jgi:hypothetical protein
MDDFTEGQRLVVMKKLLCEWSGKHMKTRPVSCHADPSGPIVPPVEYSSWSIRPVQEQNAILLARMAHVRAKGAYILPAKMHVIDRLKGCSKATASRSAYSNSL